MSEIIGKGSIYLNSSKETSISFNDCYMSYEIFEFPENNRKSYLEVKIHFNDYQIFKFDDEYDEGVYYQGGEEKIDKWGEHYNFKLFRNENKNGSEQPDYVGRIERFMGFTGFHNEGYRCNDITVLIHGWSKKLIKSDIINLIFYKEKEWVHPDG